MRPIVIGPMPGTLSSAIEHRRANRLAEAEAACRDVMARDPANAEAYACLASVLEQLGRPTEALAMYRQSVTLAPQDAEAQLSLGLVSLLLGDYGAGWRGYEWRTQGRASVGDSTPAAALPRWDGSDPRGLTILVYCEPGVGDSVQFARYLPLLGGRGADVVLVCPRPLVRLFGSLPGVCVVAEGDPPPRADVSVAIGSLPLMFGTTPATIPTFAAYLRADARLAATWRERLRPCAPAAASSSESPAAVITLTVIVRNPSFIPTSSRHFTELPGVRFVALQTCRTPAARVIDGSTASLTPDIDDVANTAALAAQLDLVIADGRRTSPTSPALGKACWTLVPFAPDWRWALTGDDSSWYPSMRPVPPARPWRLGVGRRRAGQAIKQEVALSPAHLAA